jgi:hypothetical protein
VVVKERSLKRAPREWGWDRRVTCDVIRTLCWDRVRSQNRRNKERARYMLGVTILFVGLHKV